MSDRTSLTPSQRDAILRESGYRCAVPTCNTTLAIDVHHIIEVCEGGGNDPVNLLAVCPTCHALYHRGVITRESVRRWKARLLALNNVADVQEQAEARVEKLASKGQPTKPGLGQRTGFALAASEFYWRTCEIGFRYDKGMFVTTGFCCFVAQQLALTSGDAATFAIDIGAARGGTPAIRTQRGLAPFTVLTRKKTGNLAAIEMGLIDDAHMKSLLARYKEDFSGFFSGPLQTPVKFRIVPFVGERVGLLHTAKNTEDYRSKGDFEFDTADVAFPLGRKTKDDFLQYVLTPVLSHIEHRGAPAFNSRGELVGIVRETVLLECEVAWRPIINALVDFYDILAGPKPAS